MQSDHLDEQDNTVGTCWTVGTYNVLHPVYAVKYKERPGIDSEERSNWSIRAEAIAAYMLEAWLDIYLLQEVGQSQLRDLMRSLSEHYEMTFFVHPSRQARDGTAVLTRRCSLEVIGRQAVPLPDARNRSYMSATCVFARDRCSSLLLAILSAHLYDKSYDPEGTIVKFLQQYQSEQDRPMGRCDVVIWGGDCNRVYPASGQGPPGFQHVPGGPRTHGSRQIDWIFFSSDILGSRGETTPEQFITSSQQVLSSSGNTASDHTAEAVLLSYTGVLPAKVVAKGWSRSICTSCPRLANGKVFPTCCQSCPGGHTAQCGKRNRCQNDCGRLLNAPYSSCCQCCPDRHTEQCDLRQANLNSISPLRESVAVKVIDRRS